jgi:hypothetical protein
MSETDRFMRGFTRALARRNNAQQTGEQVEPNSNTDIVEYKAIKSFSDDEYKRFITTKMIAHIRKHKEAKP